MNNFFSLFVSLFSPLRYLSLAFPSRPPSSHVPPSHPMRVQPLVSISPPSRPLLSSPYSSSYPLYPSFPLPSTSLPLPNPTPLSPFSFTTPPHRYASIPSWQLHLLLAPTAPLSLLPLPGWFPQLWWVRGRWPENWPLGERWAILVLLGSWLIIGVSDQGKINQGESWGMFGAALFTHRPRWMKLHLSVFSCITPKLVVYSFFLSLSLPSSPALSLSLFSPFSLFALIHVSVAC